MPRPGRAGPATRRVARPRPPGPAMRTGVRSNPVPSRELLLDAVPEQSIGPVVQVIDGADGCDELLGEVRRLVAVEPGPNDPAQLLGEPADATEQDLDRVGGVAGRNRFQVPLHDPCDLRAEPLQGFMPPGRAAEVIVQLVP